MDRKDHENVNYGVFAKQLESLPIGPKCFFIQRILSRGPQINKGNQTIVDYAMARCRVLYRILKCAVYMAAAVW